MWYLLLRILAVDDAIRHQHDFLAEAFESGRPGKELRNSLRLKDCSKCGQQFGYFQDRVGIEDGDDPVVPCPNCGWIQKRMYPQARRRHLRWLLYLGLGLALLSLPILGVSAIIFEPMRQLNPNLRSVLIVLFVVAVLLLLGGVITVLLKHVLSRKFNPNKTDVEDRISLGRSLALRPQEIRKVLDKIAELEQGRLN